MSFIRGSALQAYPELLREHGVDPAPVLAEVRLASADVGNHERFVPFVAYVELLEAGAALTGRADFGRALSDRQDEAMLGPLGAAATTAPTLGAGLETAARFVSVFSPAIEIELDRGPDESRWLFSVNVPGIPPHPQTLELLLRRTVALTRQHVLGGYVPKAVLLPHAPLVDAADYFRSYYTEVRFEQRAAGLLVRTPDLDRPLRSDPEVHRLVADYVEQLVPKPDETTARAVRRIVERELPAGVPPIADVARLLAVSVRTLQRRLAEDGTAYDPLVDAIRRELAPAYLADERLSIGQVARLLGYGHQSALTRACRRWFGATPSELRDGTA